VQLVYSQTPTEGRKIHATKDCENSAWRFECVPWNGPDDVLAVTFTKIGDLGEGLDYLSLVEYVKDIPMTVPPVDYLREPRFNCRVWFREALRRLHKSELFVRCYNVDSLEHALTTRATAAEYMGDLPRMYDFPALAGPWPWR
jgi:hypothetical protein